MADGSRRNTSKVDNGLAGVLNRKNRDSAAELEFDPILPFGFQAFVSALRFKPPLQPFV